MQYLSVSGALESPWERKSSRRIGYNDGGISSSKPIPFTDSDQLNDGQSEFGFIDPSEVDRSSQLPSNHLDLNHEESKPQKCDHMKVQSRITPTRLNVVRNDLLGSDIAIKPSLISEEPQRTSFFRRLRNRFNMFDQFIRLVGRISRSSNSVLPKTASGCSQKLEGANDKEFQDAIELAKDYKTDVVVNGKVAWLYSDCAEK
jgi:hypothetical protein